MACVHCEGERDCRKVVRLWWPAVIAYDVATLRGLGLGGAGDPPFKGSFELCVPAVRIDRLVTYFAQAAPHACSFLKCDR